LYYSDGSFNYSTYENYEKHYGEKYVKDLLKIVEEATDIEDLIDELDSYSEDINEDYYEWGNNKYNEELSQIVDKFVKEHR